jgi:preprotein translocase subunit SecE
VAEWLIATVLKTVIPMNSGSGVRIPPPPPGQEKVNDYIKLAIWVAVVGGLFVFMWRKGHLARLSNYVVETREELKKCTWPSMTELRGSTVVVFVATALMAIFTVSVDLVFQSVIRLML